MQSDIGCAVRSGDGADADYGFLRAGRTSKHTHADALSLELSVGGSPFVVDAGTWSYNASQRWRQFFRSTRAHSTVVVDGADQAVQHRAFRWATRVTGNAGIDHSSTDSVEISGTHDGYRRRGVGHRRQVTWNDRRVWTIVDHVEGAGVHVVDVVWILDGEVEIRDASAMVCVGGVPKMTIVMSPTPDRIDVVSGQHEPPAGWRSSRYGHRSVATSVTARYRRTLPLVVTTVLAPCAF